MTTENPNPNETTADATETGADTALGAAAVADAEGGKTETGDKVDDQAADKAAEKGDKDEAGKTDADKGDKEAGKVEGAPEKYDIEAFKMPEGVEFDKEGFEAVEPVLRDLNLTQDQAGKLMTAYGEKIVPMIQERALKAQDDAAAELRANLARDLQADPEVGGKKLDESRSFAAKAIAHFIPDKDERNEFSTFLNESGLGNEPRLMRIVAGAGKLISEATTAAASTASAPLTEAQKCSGTKGKG